MNKVRKMILDQTPRATDTVAPRCAYLTSQLILDELLEGAVATVNAEVDAEVGALVEDLAGLAGWLAASDLRRARTGEIELKPPAALTSRRARQRHVQQQKKSPRHHRRSSVGAMLGGLTRRLSSGGARRYGHSRVSSPPQTEVNGEETRGPERADQRAKDEVAIIDLAPGGGSAKRAAARNRRKPKGDHGGLRKGIANLFRTSWRHRTAKVDHHTSLSNGHGNLEGTATTDLVEDEFDEIDLFELAKGLTPEERSIALELDSASRDEALERIIDSAADAMLAAAIGTNGVDPSQGGGGDGGWLVDEATSQLAEEMENERIAALEAHLTKLAQGQANFVVAAKATGMLAHARTKLKKERAAKNIGMARGLAQTAARQAHWHDVAKASRAERQAAAAEADRAARKAAVGAEGARLRWGRGGVAVSGAVALLDGGLDVVDVEAEGGRHWELLRPAGENGSLIERSWELRTLPPAEARRYTRELLPRIFIAYSQPHEWHEDRSVARPAQQSQSSNSRGGGNDGKPLSMMQMMRSAAAHTDLRHTTPSSVEQTIAQPSSALEAVNRYAMRAEQWRFFCAECRVCAGATEAAEAAAIDDDHKVRLSLVECDRIFQSVASHDGPCEMIDIDVPESVGSAGGLLVSYSEFRTMMRSVAEELFPSLDTRTALTALGSEFVYKHAKLASEASWNGGDSRSVAPRMLGLLQATHVENTSGAVKAAARHREKMKQRRARHAARAAERERYDEVAQAAVESARVAAEERATAAAAKAAAEAVEAAAIAAAQRSKMRAFQFARSDETKTPEEEVEPDLEAILGNDEEEEDTLNAADAVGTGLTVQERTAQLERYVEREQEKATLARAREGCISKLRRRLGEAFSMSDSSRGAAGVSNAEMELQLSKSALEVASDDSDSEGEEEDDSDGDDNDNTDESKDDGDDSDGKNVGANHGLGDDGGGDNGQKDEDEDEDDDHGEPDEEAGVEGDQPLRKRKQKKRRKKRPPSDWPKTVAQICDCLDESERKAREDANDDDDGNDIQIQVGHIRLSG